jgi:hypothetical protein
VGSPPAKWIKLSPPHISLNAPNVGNVCPMQLAPIIKLGTTNAEMVSKVPKGFRHLVFNCHGHAEKPTYPAHLEIAETLKEDNVAVCRPWGDIADLRCIWLSACNIGGSGLPFCKELARQTACYVVTQTMGVPDRHFQQHCVEDYHYAMPQYIDPEGNLISRKEFLSFGKSLGFTVL